MKNEYTLFTELVKRKMNIDLSLYKEAQMKRRLISLRNKSGFADFSSYFHAMNRDDNLLQQFMDRITINVSEFFRNPKRWDVLKNKIIPDLLVTRKKLSIWSAACSTGEEPYSLALLVKEFFPSIEINILATDIDENVLQLAKLGRYKKSSLKELPDAWIKKYFTVENGIYTIDQTLKEKITFRKQNLLADEYPKDLDLILCRNVLIYFTDEAKKTIYNQFNASLSKDGILFVGSTEQIFRPEEHRFSLADTFFYKKI